MRDYASLMHLAGEYRLVELQVEKDDWLARKTLADSRLRSEGIVVLGIKRCRGDYLGLEADGWYVVRMRGNHRQFHHPLKKGTVTVAGQPSLDVPQGTLLRILRQAGLRK